MINYTKRDEAHKKWLYERFLYFKRLGDARFEERLRLIDDIIREHKFWLGFGKANAFDAECRAFLNNKYKCGGDDNGIAFSNQIRTFSNKYLIDFDWLFFIVNWLNVGRPLAPADGGSGAGGAGSEPRALTKVEVEPEDKPEPLPWEPTP